MAMTVEFTDQIEGIDWARLALVFERAPLGSRDPAQLQRAFENSQIRCFVWDAGELVGAGRALTDGIWNTMIFDVVTLTGISRQGNWKRDHQASCGSIDVAEGPALRGPGEKKDSIRSSASEK